MEPRQLRDRPRTHRRARIDIALDHRPEDVARTIVEFGDGRGRHPVHLGAAGSGWKKCSYSSSVIPAFAGMTRMIGSTLADHLADRQQIGRRSQRAGQIGRSEEHTSEFQSLMRISYAVFCLKKKKQKSLTNET